MTQHAIIDYWLEKADQDIASARENFLAGRYVNVVRDAYFACFHAFSSVLLKSGKTFRKHKEARSALHRDFIRLGKIDPKWENITTGFTITVRKQIIAHLLSLNRSRLKRLSNKARHLWRR